MREQMGGNLKKSDVFAQKVADARSNKASFKDVPGGDHIQRDPTGNTIADS